MDLRVLAISVIFLQLWTVDGSNPQPTASPTHGNFGSSVTLSPAAVKFFGPAAENDHFSPSTREEEEEAARVPSESEKRVRHPSSEDLSEGTIAGIIFGVLFGVFFVAGGSYVYVTRRSNIRRANSIRSVV